MLGGLFLIASVPPLPRGGEGLGRGGEGSTNAVDAQPGSAQGPAETPELQQVTAIVEHIRPPAEPTLAAVDPHPATDPSPAVVAIEPMIGKASEQDPEPRVAVETAPGPPEHATAAEPVTANVNEQEPVTRIVKPGDRLFALVEDVYGVRDERIVQRVKQHNPQIKSVDLIRIGDRLVFPPNDRQEPTR